MEPTTQTVTDRLMKSSKEEIPTLEREINFPSIIRSNEISIQKLRQENYNGLVTFSIACVKNYLEYCYPNNIGIAATLAADLIDSRPSWKAADFINLFKFFRQRQDLVELRVMGNQITPQKFMEMVSVYEDHRAEEMEKFRAEEKGKMMDEGKHLNNISESILEKFKSKEKPTGDAVLGKQFDRKQAEMEEKGRRAEPKVNHQKFFEK